MKPTDAQLEQQVRVSKMLGLGFVLTIVPMLGIGSLAALLIGLKAKRIIQQSNSEIAGLWMAWWCIIAGAAGIVLFPLLFLWAYGFITLTPETSVVTTQNQMAHLRRPHFEADAASCKMCV